MSILDLQVEQKPIEVQLLKSKMMQIQEQLLIQTPALATVLREIHENLQRHEELEHLLSDEDITMIHQAFEKHKQFKLIQDEVKSKKPTKKLSQNDLDNL